MKVTKLNDNTIEVERTTTNIAQFQKEQLEAKLAVHQQAVIEITELLANF